MTLLRRARSRVLIVLLVVLISVAHFSILIAHADAGNFGLVYLRYSRMIASTASNVLVVIKPHTAGTESKLSVQFAAGTTVAGTCTVDTTTNIPTGVTALPGTLTCATSGQTVTISSITGPLTKDSTLYGVNILTGVTTGTAGQVKDIVSTLTGASATIDSTPVASRFVSNDQIVINAVVPPTFNFTLNQNTDNFTSDLSVSSVVSNTGTTVTITTNAPRGWIAWVKSLNAALNSANTGTSIASTPSYGSVHVLSTGTEGYVLDAQLTTQSSTTGHGTVTMDAAYNGNGTTSGGTLMTVFEPVASSNGPTDGDVITLKAHATISGMTKASNDYTDTWTVVGAAEF